LRINRASVIAAILGRAASLSSKARDRLIKVSDHWPERPAVPLRETKQRFRGCSISRRQLRQDRTVWRWIAATLVLGVLDWALLRTRQPAADQRVASSDQSTRENQFSFGISSGIVITGRQDCSFVATSNGKTELWVGRWMERRS
jgi:hypothetical protein